MDEEELTQPATQLVIDPRRLGQGNSGLSDNDLADIVCILHPSSPPAFEAAAEIHKANPCLTISCDSKVKIREKDAFQMDEGENADSDSEGVDYHDIVIRLSTQLKDPLGGFHFGRNKQRCDYVIGQYSKTRRISNIHFRIYINEYNVIMLEDQSTNGTAVDGTLLRFKDKENGRDYRHTLTQGSIVVLTMTPPEQDYRFVVRIPQRDEESDKAYQNNLTAFFLRLNAIRLGNETQLAGGTRKGPVNLFPTRGTATPNPTSMTSGKSIREWRGGAKYNRVGCIGKGAFAVVYKITDKFNGIPYAAKELEKRRFMKNGVLDQKVDMEMKIMKKITHDNVVQYIEHVDWEEYLYIIMEFVPGGDLGTLINQNGHLPETDVKIMAGQLLSALKYLHNMGITHRDVKPDNILISQRQPFHVKLTDFGLSKMIDSEETFLRTFCGTLLYCAPEVYSEYREYDYSGQRTLRGVDRKALPPQRYGHAVDIWSLAGVLFYALCGSPPYPVQNGTSYQELLHQIMSKPLDIRPLQGVNVCDNGIRFVRKMLHVRPAHRATIFELEESSWLLGGDSLQASIEADEIDMVVDSDVDPNLEHATSQLSFREVDNHEIEDSDVFGNEDVSGFGPHPRLEIPSSFSTNESKSFGNSSFGGQNTAKNGTRNGQLFGEVNASRFGSSGAIPADLALPLPTAHHRGFDSTISQAPYRESTQSRIDTAQLATPQQPHYQVMAGMPNTLGPPPPPDSASTSIETRDIDQQAKRSSSLMGAESMVGNLNMHSPASVISPNLDSPSITTEDMINPMVSHRRPRSEYESVESDDLWRPADLPPKRPRTSSRVIDREISKMCFWDMKDPSTKHDNYPKMTVSDFTNYEQYARSKGEEFKPGQKTFETTMQSFRSSRSPSRDIDYAARAYSEPRRFGPYTFKRDDRKLAASENGYSGGRDAYMAGASPSPSVHSVGTPEVRTASNSPQIGAQPVVGNDFQRPKRILGKIISTTDSCLPTISLNITESVTSWGRGEANTIRYSNANEVRIPKYAFKIFLFKPGFYNTERPVTPGAKVWTDNEQDMTFYISTKSTHGIWINNTKLSSHDRQRPDTESKYWGELRHNDIITVWFNTMVASEYTRFRFECFWGKSKEFRGEDLEIGIVQAGPFLTELETACLQEENKILLEQQRLEEEEIKVLDLERGRSTQQEPVNLTQSFSSAPYPAQ